MSLVNGIGGMLGGAFHGAWDNVVDSVGGKSTQMVEEQGSGLRSVFGDLGKLFRQPQAWVEQKDEFIVDPSGDDQRINIDPSKDDITINLFGNKITLDPSGDDFTVHIDPSGDSVRIPFGIFGTWGGLFGQGK